MSAEGDEQNDGDSDENARHEIPFVFNRGEVAVLPSQVNLRRSFFLAFPAPSGELAVKLTKKGEFMMKVLVLFVLAVSFGVVASADSGVYGSWKVPTFSEGDFTFDVTFTFSKNKVSATNVCSSDGFASKVQASVNAVIDDHSITTTSEKSAKNGECSIDIAKGTMTYSVSPDGKSLTLSSEGQTSSALTRVQP